jgi:hypothetical protein
METSPIDAALGAMLAATLAASPLPAIIDAEQAAALLQCSKCQVEMLAERGEVPGTKFGRGWIFVTAQLIHCVLVRCAQRVRDRDRTSPSEPGTALPHSTTRSRRSPPLQSVLQRRPEAAAGRRVPSRTRSGGREIRPG